MNAVGVVDVGSTNLSYVAATPTGEFLTWFSSASLALQGGVER
ncbi:hypothetical protein [Natronococcus sp. A-GB7]|nr:hypothetical protein [Natronococcus sp. A-GB7]MDG5818647.1 hypothetical protein [Natronococcus sp. A-GB7]